ncbi:MAG: protein kinase [Planctomycetes bacterium]|nr:protein kinase [Planctomycetota bacterium]
MNTARHHTCVICGSEFIPPENSVVLHCSNCESAQTNAAGSVAASLDATVPDQNSPNVVRDPNKTLIGTASEFDCPTIDVDPALTKTQPATGDGSQPGARTKFGRFVVMKVLGRGGFGTVFHAYDPLLDRHVALKVPNFSRNDTTMMERFRREAKAAARLHHPNIVSLYEHGETNDGPYLVSEYIDGDTLFQVIRNGKFEIRQAVEWVRQICEALNYAHGEGIVHRDIKPGNIMLKMGVRPMVMDFGLAKRDVDVDSNVTIEGQIIGTANYMSPEQARGEIATSTSLASLGDQYSVGVVLYELLCGRTPYSGPTVFVISQVGNPRITPPAPRSIRSTIPPDLEACCLKAIEKDPQQRYTTIKDMATDLDHWLKGLPLIARPIGPAERLIRWCRANRMIASLTGVLALIMLFMAIVGPWTAVRFKKLAAEANQARLETERILIDNYTESGLSADRDNDPGTAVLWFGSAVAASANHPELERLNRIRMQSWIPKLVVPIYAFSFASNGSRSISYHPDGQAVLNVSSNGDIDWIDVQNGTRHRLAIPNPSAATWNHDGHRMAVASGKTVAIFEFPSGTLVDQWEASEAISILRFSPNDELLFQGGSNSVQIRDLPGKSLRPPLMTGMPILGIEVSPDSRRFATRDRQSVRVWSTAHDRPDPLLMPPQPAVSEGEVIPYFISENKMVLFDSQASAVRCWNVDEQKIVWELAARRVLTMALSGNRQWLAYGDDAEAVIVDTTNPMLTPRKIPHKNLLHGLSFHPKTGALLTASNDNFLRMFDLWTGTPVGPPIPHNAAAHHCAWSPDGTTFTSVDFGGRLLRIWKPSDSSPHEVAVATADGPFIQFSPDGERWMSSGFDAIRTRKAIRVIDATTSQPVGQMLSGGLISDAAFIPASTQIVLVGGAESDARLFRDQNPDGPGYARVVDSANGKAIFPDVSTPSLPIAVRVSPTGDTAVVLCHLGNGFLLDLKTGNVRSQFVAFEGLPATHGFIIRDRIRFSPDGTLFAIWGCQQVGEVRDSKTGELKYQLPHESHYIHDVQFSPDGQLIASCSSDHTVRLWNSADGKITGSPLHHPSWIFSAQFSGDSRQLLTACDDRHVRLWDVKTGTTVLATQEHRDQVFGVCQLPSEKYFLACDRSGGLTAYDRRFGKMIAPMRHIPGMVYQLSTNGRGENVVASGKIDSCRSFHWRDWIIEQPLNLDRHDMLLLGEIVSGKQLHQGGAVASLTTLEWMERWQQFHTRHSLRAIVEQRTSQ